MHILEKTGITLFVIGLLVFTASLGLEEYILSDDSLAISNTHHAEAVITAAENFGITGKTYGNPFDFIEAFKKALNEAQESLEISFQESGAPDGVSEWDYRLGDWKKQEYTLFTVKHSSVGLVSANPLLFWLLTIGLSITGGLLFIIPAFQRIPGIKNDHIYHSPMTRGNTKGWRIFFLSAVIGGVILYGFYYMNRNLFWPALTVIMGVAIISLVFFAERQKELGSPRSVSPLWTGWLGIGMGLYLIGFYILLYWQPQFITPWMLLSDPLSRSLSGNEASQWFLYGMLYTVIVLVMGVRMIAKYRHNRYQMIRTGSVMFFQTAFAFLIPEILVRLNYPYFDFKNIWPLNYTFFFDYNLNNLIESGALGIFMLVWGIALIVIAVPVFTYFYGKRWYCSWVCGCGGLAETLGDPYRQLSDKSLVAWRFERWIVHGVLAFAVVMTGFVLYTYFSGQSNILFMSSDSIRAWYGFLIGSAFAGVVGTGFYPIMGNRVWCRFGCPLAAYLGLVQRFKSRFRITTNGGQCISCGNCSTYCEMGIDVRWYAQRGQNVVRASCVGCGICAAVCPRGVLRLENSSGDINSRTEELKVIHIKENEVTLMS